MAKKKNSGISSEAVLLILIVLMITVLTGYYLYTEIQLGPPPITKLPDKPKKEEPPPKKEPAFHIVEFVDDVKNMLPASKSGNPVVHHFAYSLAYDEKSEQAEWVVYRLTDDYVLGEISRTDNFKMDPLITSESASNSDYLRSGYDKGHLAPAADMRWNDTAMNESFYLSNVTPQNRGFNRGIWRQLEEQVRDWAMDNEDIYIVTGAVLSETIDVIGKNEVVVPKYYYKVILDVSPPDIKGIGFLLENKKSDIPLSDLAITIDSVEQFTGIDFFPILPNYVEDELESKSADNLWLFNE